jgi:predicted heme/steroid binding protein
MQIFPALILLLFILPFPRLSFATPDYARQTGFECKHCHIDAIGSGPLTQAGKSFLEDMKVKGLYRPLTSTQQFVRLIIGYLHLMTAIVWFGTIMYVHVLLKPAYASKGLPKGELRLGWISMILILITGVLLTISRIPSWHMFITTRFGILLSIKIFLFLIMLTSAFIVTIYIGPRLRKQKAGTSSLENGACTLDGLCQFDGKDGRPAYIAYKGIIYDVTGSRLWKNGSHVMKHAAGNDLTDILKTAPHGEDKILAMPQVGKLLAVGANPIRPFHERLFYFFAYMNLVLVFVITFIIALWRWW